MSVGVNPPKTPVTTGSKGLATATLPNVCKMPGPPAPFVPTPLPNIGKSGNTPKDYTKTVTVEGDPVAINGASFCSIGDVASQALGGGMISSNTQGPCKFIAPGSMDVKFEGGNVHLLSDQVTNNGAAGSGTPANAATMVGLVQLTAAATSEKPGTVCPGGGDHEWVQITGSGTKSLDDKIKDLKSAPPGTGTHYEGLAAEHNKDVSKNLTKSSDLSEGNDEIRMMCNVNGCPFNTNAGGSPETDHVTRADPNDKQGKITEVKSDPDFDERAARQMGRNFQAVDQGVATGVTMKYPSGSTWDQAEADAKALASALGKTLEIVRF
jgi:hypothetical protein